MCFLTIGNLNIDYTCSTTTVNRVIAINNKTIAQKTKISTEDQIITLYIFILLSWENLDVNQTLKTLKFYLKFMVITLHVKKYVLKENSKVSDVWKHNSSSQVYY